MGLLKSDGTITYAEFQQGAQDFVLKWKKVCLHHDYDLPSWSWISPINPPFNASHQVVGYLSLEQMPVVRYDKIYGNNGGHSTEKQHNCLSGSGESTDAVMLAQESEEVHFYDFHIVYNNSYRIPVLYFRGYSCDGHPLMLNQIEQDLPKESAKVLGESKWTFITQQEHPHLNRPWYTLHPCGTNELMRLLSNDSMTEHEDAAKCYIISWLSVVSQVVGLRIPLELGTPDQT